jgi:hypothetical protein
MICTISLWLYLQNLSSEFFGNRCLYPFKKILINYETAHFNWTHNVKYTLKSMNMICAKPSQGLYSLGIRVWYSVKSLIQSHIRPRNALVFITKWGCVSFRNVSIHWLICTDAKIIKYWCHHHGTKRQNSKMTLYVPLMAWFVALWAISKGPQLLGPLSTGLKVTKLPQAKA